MDQQVIIRSVALAVTLVATSFLLRSLWRDLRRPQRRADAQADLVALYYLVIASGCWLAFLVMLVSVLTAPDVFGLAALPLLAGLGSAAAIRFVPATQAAWQRIVTRLRGAR